jgi:hypothetical protein
MSRKSIQRRFIQPPAIHATATAVVEIPRQYLTLKELCQKSRFSPATIHRLKARGLIPFLQPAGPRGHLRFPLDALDACRQKLNGGEEAMRSESEPPKKSGQPKKLTGRRPKWMLTSPGISS